MYFIVSVLIIIVSLLLILIVLVQNSKGGGLASNFSSSNQVMGVRKTTDFLEKATWVLAISLLFFSLVASITIPRGEEAVQESRLKSKAENFVDPNEVPAFPQQGTPPAKMESGNEQPKANTEEKKETE